MTDLIKRDDALAAIQDYAVQEVGAFRQPHLKGAADAILALPAVTVGVKPLVWRGNGKGRVCADTPFGAYEVEHGRYGMRLLHGGSFMQDDLQGIEAAKAACRADYEARILAALIPPPVADSQPTIDPAAIREAALREAMDACIYVIKNIEILKADGETYETPRIQKIARGLVDVARQQIEALIGEKK